MQRKNNFSNWSYPVLTTTQNDEKAHTFYSNSLVINLYGHIMHGETCTDKMNVSEQES